MTKTTSTAVAVVTKAAATVALKRKFRTNVRRQLRTLSHCEKIRQTRLVCETVLESGFFRAASKLAVFMSTDAEICTDLLVARAFETGKMVFVPRCQSNRMEFVRLYSIEDFLNLPLNRWNIREPNLNEIREDVFESRNELDLILVPGVAFTKQGIRLGHGKGYYDRFLFDYVQKFNRKPHTVALAFKQQIFDHVPYCNHDYIVDRVIHAC